MYFLELVMQLDFPSVIVIREEEVGPEQQMHNYHELSKGIPKEGHVQLY
jgi:hypothetical protein